MQIFYKMFLEIKCQVSGKKHCVKADVAFTVSIEGMKRGDTTGIGSLRDRCDGGGRATVPDSSFISGLRSSFKSCRSIFTLVVECYECQHL